MQAEIESGKQTKSTLVLSFRGMNGEHKQSFSVVEYANVLHIKIRANNLLQQNKRTAQYILCVYIMLFVVVSAFFTFIIYIAEK